MSSSHAHEPLERRYRYSHPLQTFFALLANEKGKLFAALLIGVGKHTPLMFMPIVVGNVVNIITDPTDQPIRDIGLNTAFIAILLALNIPLHMQFIGFMSRAIRSVEARLRNALVWRMQELSVAFHEQFQTGRLHSKVLRDVESIELLCRHLLNNVFMALMTLVFAMSVAVYREPLVALFFLLSIPFAVALIVAFRKRIARRNRELRTEVESMSAMVSEMLTMLPITRAHAVEHTEARRIGCQFEKVKHKGIKVDKANALFGASSWVTFHAFQFACLLFTGFLAFRGRIEVGDVVMYQGFFADIVRSVSMIIGVLPNIARGFESIRSLGEVLECPDIEYNRGKKQVGTVDGAFRFERVSFTYPDAADAAIRDFDFDISPGECVAFVGESGSGKSTLMNLVMGFRRPQQGRILLDGQDMQELDLRTYRRSLAVVPQENVLYSGSIRDNILYGLDNVAEQRLREIIEMANVAEFVEKLPDGLDTVVGEHGARLSGGQRQRVAIARALVREPKVIILDEATSALDVASERLVQEAIERLTAGRTTLIVAHRLSTIRKANRIVVLRRGELIETGTHNELVAHRGEFHRFLSLQT